MIGVPTQRRAYHLPRRPQVAMVSLYVPQYRAPFYELLRTELDHAGVDLRLYYSAPVREHDVAKHDAADVPWGKRISTRVLARGDKTFVWQTCFREVLGADLLIVGHANMLLVNNLFLLTQHTATPRLAFWGHGEDFKQRGARSWRARLKNWTARRADWWFTHTDISADVLAAHGVDLERVTVVNNALDTKSLADQRVRLRPEEVAQVKADLGVSGNNVCAYLGALYPAKRLPFLLEACALMRQGMPDFELLVVGDGPDRQLVEDAARTHPWVHYAGARFGRERVACLAGCRLLLVPGAVGLVLLDSFALELPLITTAVPTHGPEIAYLRDGDNGVIVSEHSDPSAYADAVISVLSGGRPSIEDLRDGCRLAQAQYTLEGMARRFARGVLMALES